MSITKLNCMELKDTRYSVYPYDGYNLEEILGKFYEAIKECNDLSFSLQEFNTWLIDEGLKEEVLKQLTKIDWDNIVNSELYQTVIERLLNTNNRIEEVKNELSSQLDNLRTNINNGNLSNINNKLKGASIYLPYNQLVNRTFEENVIEMINTNCNTVSICPIFWQETKETNVVGLKSPLTLDKLVDNCKYAKEQGLTVIFKPHIGGDEISSWGDIQPGDINGWLNDYFELFKETLIACKDYVDIVSVSNELEGQTNSNLDKWSSFIDEVRLIKQSFVLTCSNTATEIITNVFLNKLDVLGVNLYVKIGGNLQTDIDYQRQNLFTKTIALTNLGEVATRLNKPILITEVGILPYINSFSNPGTWDKKGEINYDVQCRYYEVAVKEYIKAFNVLGVIIWCANDDFTFIGHKSQEVLKDIFGGKE